MAFATFLIRFIIFIYFFKWNLENLFFYQFYWKFFIFLAIYLHPFYNDFKVIESTQYHQGQKIEKFFFNVNDDTEKKFVQKL